MVFGGISFTIFLQWVFMIRGGRYNLIGPRVFLVEVGMLSELVSSW